MTALTIIQNTGAELANIDSTANEAARQLIAAQFAVNTKTAYRHDFNQFAAFCKSCGANALPAEPATVANYIAQLQSEGKAVATVLRAMAAITKAHKLNGLQSPVISEAAAAMEGMKRTNGTAQKQAQAIRTDGIAQAVKQIDINTLRGLRDKAVLLLGFAGCFRRSEIAALTVADVTFNNKGADIRIKRSKTDQTGAGDFKAIPYGSNPATCPVRSLQAWLNVYQATGEAPLFCTITKGDKLDRSSGIVGKTVERIVKQYFGSDYSGHSLRVGFG